MTPRVGHAYDVSGPAWNEPVVRYRTDSDWCGDVVVLGDGELLVVGMATQVNAATNRVEEIRLAGVIQTGPTRSELELRDAFDEAFDLAKREAMQLMDFGD